MTMSERRDVDINAAFELGTPIEEALNRGIQEAMRRHKLLGLPAAEWDGQRVVWVPAADLLNGAEPAPGEQG